MPKQTISVRFPEGDASKYIMDNGDAIIASAVFNLPPDIDSTGKAAILNAIGGVEDADLPPCRINGTLRKLVFLRAQGNTMSVPVRTRQDLLSAATAIQGVLNSGGSSDNPVVCIYLMGEEFANLNDELGISYTAGTFAKTHRADANATKQYMWSGNVEYEADSTNPAGGVIFQPVKTMTDVENTAPTQLGSEWSGCAGDFILAVPCPRPRGRRNPLQHRRYTLTLLTKSQEVADAANPPAGVESDFEVEQTEVPVKHHEASLIKTCGQALATLTGVYCIGYQGESYKLFDKLLA